MSIAHTPSWAALVAVGLLALAPAARAQFKENRVDLRPRFQAGQTVKYRMAVTNTSSPQTFGPPPPTGAHPEPPDQSSSKIEMGLSLKVRSVSPEHEAVVDLVFETLKVSSHTRDQTVEFDSTKPAKGEDDVVGLLMQPLVGSTLTLHVDRTGSITSITGGESFTALGQFISGGGDPGGLFGPLLSAKHGNGIATVGESWENVDRVDSPLLGRFKMISRHTLRGASGREAKLALSGHIDPDSEGGGNGPAHEGQFKVKESRYAGTYSWDLGMGMLKDMDSTLSVTMEQTVEGKRSTTRNESVMKVTRQR